MEQLKLLLGITDTAKDELLNLILTETEDFIKGYCHVDEVPLKLNTLVPFMAADLYRYKGYGAEVQASEVKSITQGERTVQYNTVTRSDEVFASYYKRLNPFRRARVPSEVI